MLAFIGWVIAFLFIMHFIDKYLQDQVKKSLKITDDLPPLVRFCTWMAGLGCLMIGLDIIQLVLKGLLFLIA